MRLTIGHTVQNSGSLRKKKTEKKKGKGDKKMAAVNQREEAYRRNIRNASYYVDGSAARVPEPAFAPQPDQRRRHHRQHRQDPRYMAAPRSTCVSVNIPITVLLVVTLVISVLVGYRYLCLKSSLDTHMNSIKTLETSEYVKQYEDIPTGQ